MIAVAPMPVVTDMADRLKVDSYPSKSLELSNGLLFEGNRKFFAVPLSRLSSTMHLKPSCGRNI